MTVEQAIKLRIERFDRLFKAGTGKPFAKDDLYHYEMSVINQAKSIIDFMRTIGPLKEVWVKLTEDHCTIMEFVERLKTQGYDGWDDGHSGNSASQSIFFVNCLINERKIFPYMHGALAQLVGDAGYYDDRSDIPEMK